MSSQYEKNKTIATVTGKYVKGEFVCPIKYRSYRFRQRIHALLKDHLPKHGTKTYNDTLNACEAMCYFRTQRNCNCTSQSVRVCLSSIEDSFPKIKERGDIYAPAYLEGILKKEVFAEEEKKDRSKTGGEKTIKEILNGKRF